MTNSTDPVVDKRNSDGSFCMVRKDIQLDERKTVYDVLKSAKKKVKPNFGPLRVIHTAHHKTSHLKDRCQEVIRVGVLETPPFRSANWRPKRTAPQTGFKVNTSVQTAECTQHQHCSMTHYLLHP